MSEVVPLGEQDFSEWAERVWQARREHSTPKDGGAATTDHGNGGKPTSAEASAVAETLDQAITQRAVKWMDEGRFLVGMLQELLEENERLRTRVTALEQAVEPPRRPNDIVELAPTGALDMDTAGRLKLQDHIKAGKIRIVVDLGGVDYIDSAGLGEIVSAMKRTRQAGGDLRLCALRDDVLRIFEITGLHKAFSIFPTRQEALASWE